MHSLPTFQPDAWNDVVAKKVGHYARVSPGACWSASYIQEPSGPKYNSKIFAIHMPLAH
jgi:hypothetical protein